MVWNHPHISPTRMLYLRTSLIRYLNNPINIYVKEFSRMLWDRFRTHGFDFIWRDLIKGPIAAALADELKQVFIPKLGEKETRG